MNKSKLLEVFRRSILLFSVVAISIMVLPAQGLFDKMQKELQLNKGVRFDYTSTLKDKNGRALQSNSGSLIVKGRLFRLNDQVTAVYNGKTLTYYNPQDNTLNLSNPAEEELIQINPFVVINSARNYYNIQENGTQITLNPKKRGNIVKVTIQLDNRNKPTFINVFMRDSSQLQIKMANQVQVNVSNSTFVLGKRQYPNAEVVDMR
ncbi:MAG: LolA-like putative outer membrane lipoprotein chaperone [Porphyromonadaceae bacterium]|nr:LolA-like putative outer membrane lipoprotein chaperone [Porphyromonadaceae bacterium]